MSRTNTERCDYCGEPASGGTSSGGIRQAWCEPCRKEYVEFLSRVENLFPRRLPDDTRERAELLRKLDRIHEEAEAHVRQRATDRKKPGR